MATPKTSDERSGQAARPARKPWHKPQFSMLDAVEGTGTTPGTKNDGAASHS
jgi:hypothetical protein